MVGFPFFLVEGNNYSPFDFDFDSEALEAFDVVFGVPEPQDLEVESEWSDEDYDHITFEDLVQIEEQYPLPASPEESDQSYDKLEIPEESDDSFEVVDINEFD